MNGRVALFLVGCASVAGQVVLLRETAAALFGVELMYVVALGTWLVGTAAGAVAASRLPPFGPRAPAIGLAVAGPLLIVEVLLIRAAPVLLGATTGTYLPLPEQVLVLLAGVLPVSVVLGALFTGTARTLVAIGHPLGVLYAIESLGAMLAGIAATVLFATGAATFAVAVGCATVCLLVPIAAGVPRWRPARTGPRGRHRHRRGWCADAHDGHRLAARRLDQAGGGRAA